MPEPTVSIGMPVYNGEKYLPNALTTLLNQDFEDFELIVSDNASSDRTQEICRMFAARDTRIRYFRNEKNIGLSANHNRAFELARARYFKWAAHDDEFPRPMLGRFVNILEQAPPSVAVVYSQCEYIDESGNVVGVDSDGAALDSPSAAKRLAHLVRHVHMFNSVYGLFRSDTLRKTRLHGRYPGSDYVLMGELAMLGSLVEIPEPLLRIRRHPGRSFNANKTPESLRALFAPGQDTSSRLSLKSRMEYELVRSAWIVPVGLKDKLSCTAVAVVTPQWRTFRAYGGRQKRKAYALFSSIEPPFRAGDVVEVRSKEEILKTLDKNGQLDGMPFMPEMFEYCGKFIRIDKRADKTCDTVYEYKGRRMKNAVHLAGTRCNGEFHGGCQALCLMYWKTAWLRSPARPSSDLIPPLDEPSKAPTGERAECTELEVLAGTEKRNAADNEPTYICQATHVPAATEPLPWWAIGQYIEDYTSGNVGLARMLKSIAFKSYHHYLVNLGIGWGPALRWIYDRFQALRGGTPYPIRDGTIPTGQRTPVSTLDLQPGEWVRTKSYETIRSTCDARNLNRGMTFDKEMVPYLGGTYKVLRRVTRIINEKTGRMQEMKNPCIILDSVVLSGQVQRRPPLLPQGRLSVLAGDMAGASRSDYVGRGTNRDGLLDLWRQDSRTDRNWSQEWGRGTIIMHGNCANPRRTKIIANA